jgi:phospholipase/carboxylesterase
LTVAGHLDRRALAAVIPRELLDRTWDYLRGDLGAVTVARRDPVGHGIAAAVVPELARWLQQRLT